MKFVFLDTDLFVRSLRYERDAQQENNRLFLERVRSKKIRAATSLFNVLETCGVLSFNYSTEDLLKLYANFAQLFSVKILATLNDQGEPRYLPEKIFSQILKKQSLGDAQMSYVVKEFSDKIECLVTWNAKHFRNKVVCPVFTPQEFLHP